jgi:hypothetical protein
MSIINETKWCDMTQEQKNAYFADLAKKYPDTRSDYERERADFASRYYQMPK